MAGLQGLHGVFVYAIMFLQVNNFVTNLCKKERIDKKDPQGLKGHS